MQWLLYAVLAAVLNALMDFFVKLSSNKIDTALGGVLLTACATIVMVLPVVFSKVKGEPLLVTREGALYSIAAGIAVGLATFFIFKMFATRVELSIAIPTLRIGIIVCATLLGVFFLGEKVSARLLFGMMLSLVGVYFVVTSPR